MEAKQFINKGEIKPKKLTCPPPEHRGLLNREQSALEEMNTTQIRKFIL